MKTIFLDKKEIQLTKDDLPMLIHGEDHAGASFYTISLIANLFLKGHKVIVLCGYYMAEEQFKEQIDNLDEKLFYTKEQVSDFNKAVSIKEDINEYIFLLKNVELFNEEVIESFLKRDKFIISGDLNKSPFKEQILERTFKTKIYFSNIPNIEIPILNKY
ncbi:MAG: hypothetical protein KBB16_01390, partial [Candidatus Pacebacteria bacterium]|nr:hypothetical protein [Candidatus Paceibacterota bacterium]